MPAVESIMAMQDYWSGSISTSSRRRSRSEQLFDLAWPRRPRLASIGKSRSRHNRMHNACALARASVNHRFAE